MELNKLTQETVSSSHARIAGILYLVIIVCGIFSEAFVRTQLFVPDDPAATADNILRSSGLFRVGFAADTIMLFCDVAIAVLFYLLLKPVSKTLSLTAAAFRLIQAAILGFNLLNYYAAFLLLSGDIYTNAFTAEQLKTLALLALELHSHGYDLGLLFFALSSMILGYLVTRSVAFPAVFGYELIAAAVVYLVGSFTRFLLPDAVPVIAPAYIIPLIAELSFCLWLLLKGVRTQP